MFDLIILANLLEGPKHGYALKKQAGMVFAHPELHNNLVYPLLRRFTGQGWVTKKSAPGERGQTRHQYALTPAGRRVLLQRLNAFGEKEIQSSEDFLLRIGLFPLLEPASRQRMLDLRQQILGSRQEHYAKLRQIPMGTFGGEVVDFLHRRAKQELTWIRRLRRLSAASSQPAAQVPASATARNSTSKKPS